MRTLAHVAALLLACGSSPPPAETPPPEPEPEARALEAEVAVEVEPSPVEEPPPEETETAPAETTEPAPAEVGCTRGSCPDGQMCTGPEGCDLPWTCQPAHPCTRDLRPFCGCDGTTFRGSSRCPDRPYAHRGACGSTME